MRIIGLITFVCAFLLIACQTPEDKIKKSEVIPVDELIPILVEMHLADGLLHSVSMRAKYPGRDSISNYLDILNKHDVSKETFDRTIEFYENDPDKLNDLYEEVISELTKFQSEIHQSGRQKLTDEQILNIWNQKDNWRLPDGGTTNRIEFNIPVYEPGNYILTATIRMHLDDGSKNPRVTAYFWFNDGTESGFRIPFESIPIEKNSRIKVYTLSLNLEDTRVTHIRGFLLDHDPQPRHWENHVDILNVKLQLIPSKKEVVGRD